MASAADALSVCILLAFFTVLLLFVISLTDLKTVKFPSVYKGGE